MSREIEISVDELVPQTMSRARAQEAAEALRKTVRAKGASRVYLHMRADSVITTSFIDELVRQAGDMERAGTDVIFVITDEDMLKRFQTSVTWRGISCRYRESGENKVKTLRPSEAQDTTPRARTATKSELPVTP